MHPIFIPLFTVLFFWLKYWIVLILPGLVLVLLTINKARRVAVGEELRPYLSPKNLVGEQNKTHLKRKVMFKPGFIRVLWIMLLFFIPIGACLTGLSFVWELPTEPGEITQTGLLYLGVFLLVVPTSIVFVARWFDKSRANSLIPSEAKVVARYKDKVEVGDGPGADWIKIAVNNLEPYEYSVVIEFLAEGSGGFQLITLTATKVSEKLYNQLMLGSITTVHYARRNPAYALLEGE